MLVIVSLICTVVFNSASICWSLVLSCLFWLSSEVTLILFYPKHSLPPDSDYNNNMLLTPRKRIPECLESNRGQRPGCSNWQRQSVGQVRSGAGRHSGQRRTERENWGHAQQVNAVYIHICFALFRKVKHVWNLESFIHFNEAGRSWAVKGWRQRKCL